MRYAGYYIGGAKEGDWPWYEFRVSASCPPDKRVHMRGGTLWMGPGSWDYTNFGTGNIIDAQVADFEDSSSIGRDVTFATASYYQSYILLFGGDNPYVTKFVLWGTTSEWATAVEAEQSIMQQMTTEFIYGILDWEEQPWMMGYPVCGVILRNDSITGAAGAILPIDAINRGRSYIWPTDMRPRHYTGG